MAKPKKPTCPEPLDALLDRTFLEYRAKLLDLAAFLDRCDRAPGSSNAQGDTDFRLAALRNALELLSSDQPDRTRQILEQLSDPTTDLLDKAPGKGASGAPQP
ncbi:hypothetical protein [Algisphaera agarilytica]|uniref:Uncharacterized protein n=1 Tax=Algisphaera agarilytica TaxID=1385975 RepID=A0A7X0HBD0_9BACT|nr:hypothetical protein [Algisphaera agarilytica]MBB6431289.1 hypothetical protein [Algisphaera agarilytica]